MNIFSITRLVSETEISIGQFWSDSEFSRSTNQRPTFCQKEVVARIAHFALILPSVAGGVLDGLVGLGGMAVTIISCGSFPNLTDDAFDRLYGFQEVLTGPFRHLLKTFNPGDKFSFSSSLIVSAGGMGLISDLVINKIHQFAQNCRYSEHFVLNSLAPRLSYLILAITCIFTRAIDGVIGIFVSFAALVTFGTIKEINNAAYRALQAPNIIGDLLLCAKMCLNPSSQSLAKVMSASYYQDTGRWV